MVRAFYLVYAGLCYAIFFAIFLYLIAFVGNLPVVPVTIDAARTGPMATAVAVDIALVALFGCWYALPATVWAVENGIGAGILWALFASGWAIVLLSTFLLNHFELFGLQQAWFALRERAAAVPQLHQPLFYKIVRHPLYAGFFIAFWATPRMSVGHLLFAVGMSAYMLIAIRFEERDLIATFGGDYVAYRERVGMLVPRL